MMWSPTDRFVVENAAVALEFEAIRLTGPSNVAPSLKLTRPVGAVEPLAGVTVAVKVTESPQGDGVKLLVTVMVVFVKRGPAGVISNAGRKRAMLDW